MSEHMEASGITDLTRPIYRIQQEFEAPVIQPSLAHAIAYIICFKVTPEYHLEVLEDDIWHTLVSLDESRQAGNFWGITEGSLRLDAEEDLS